MPVKSTDIPSFDDVMGSQPKGNTVPSYSQVMGGSEKKSPVASTTGSTNGQQGISSGTNQSDYRSREVVTKQLLQGNNSYNPQSDITNFKYNPQQAQQNIQSNLEYGTPLPKTNITGNVNETSVFNPKAEAPKVQAKRVSIENTVNKKLSQQGITPNDTRYESEKSILTTKYKDQLENGDLAIGTDENGELGLRKKIGFFDSYVGGYNNTRNAGFEAANFQKLTPDERVNYTPTKEDNEEFLSPKLNPIASFIGGTQSQLEKPIAGGITAAAATGTGQAEVLPTAARIAMSTEDSYNRDLMNEYQRVIPILKQQHPDWSNKQLDDEAMSQAKVAGQIGAVGNAAFWASGGEAAPTSVINTPIKKELSEVVAKTLKNTLKMPIYPTATKLVTEEIGNVKNVPTSQGQIFNDAVDEYARNLTPAAIFEGLHLAGELPTTLSNSLKYAVKDVPEGDVRTELKNQEDAGRISQGSADMIADDLKNYNIALSKIPESLQADKKAQVADLIDKKNKLIEASKTKDSNFKENYDTQIAAIDDHIKNILQEPTEEDVADARAKELTAKMKQKPAPDYLLSRHGDTIKDEEGKVSGTDMHPLSEDGKRDANMLADDVVKQSEQSGVPVTKVVSSDLERAKETAKTVADKTGAAIHHDEDLRTWDIGQFNETPDKEFKKIQQWFVEHPDEKIYKPELNLAEGEKPEDKDPNYGKKIGESFNDYAQRTIEAHKKYEGEPASTMLIDHSNNMMVMDAYRKNGNVWDENAAKEYLKSEKPEPATLQTKNIKNETSNASADSDIRGRSDTNGNDNTQNKQSQQPTEEAQQSNTGVNQTAQPTEKWQEDVTSIRNAVTGMRREQLGLDAAEEPLRKTFGTTWDEAKAKIENGFNTQDLVDELKKKPRPLTDVEDALLLHHQNVKELELMHTNEQINKAAESGNEGDLAEAQVRRARLLDELQDTYDVNKASGTETARGLAARRMMADRRFNLVNMMAEKRAANDGKPLSEEQTAEVEKLHNKIQETQQAFDEYRQKAHKEIIELQDKIVSKKITDKKSAANKLRAFADKIDKETQGKVYSSIIPITPKMISGAIRLIADGLEKGEELVNLVKKAIGDIKKENPDVDEKELERSINRELINSGINSTAKERKQVKDLSGIVFDRNALKLKAEAERAKNAYDISLKKDEEKKKSFFQKVQNKFVKWQRAFKLSNPVTMGKLAVAGLTRLTTTPLEDVAGGVLNTVLPKSLTKGAIGEGGGLNVKETAKAYKDGIIRGMSDAAQIMKRKGEGKSDIDTVFGKSGQLPPEAIDFFGQLHSATKAPFKRAIFERALSKRLRRSIANGADVSDPMVQTEIATGAYKDANRAIFMQDNKVATGWQKMVNYFETVDKKTGKAPAPLAATAMQWLLPFIKVPTNIASEIGTNIYGVPVGAARAIHGTFTKGLENLSADEKDVIIRDLKKGSLGAAALTLGYMNPQIFGGYYQEHEKRKPTDAKAGAVKIGGVNIPAWMIESPIFQAMQIGATIRRVKDTKVKGEEQGIGEGVWAGALGLAQHVPLVDQPVRMTKVFTSPKERGWYLGELAKGTVDPALIQKIAEWTYPAEKRSPSTIGQHIESGLPFLREQVPVKGGKGGKGGGGGASSKY